MGLDPGLGKNLNRGDSVSRCSDNQSIYDYVGNPRLHLTAKPLVRCQLDTIEASNKHRDKETANRLLKNYWALALFVSGGKIFLLVLVLPFRFTLFTFPKFLAMEVVPQAFEIIKPLLGKLEGPKRKLELIMKKSLLGLSRLKRYPILLQKRLEVHLRKVLRQIRDKAVGLALPIVKGVKLSKDFLRVISKVIAFHSLPAAKFFKKLAANMKDLAGQSTSWIKPITLSARQLVNSATILPKIFEGAKDALAKIGKYISEGALNALQPLVTRAFQMSLYITDLAKEMRLQVLHYARPLAETISQGSKKFTDACKAPVVAIARALVNRIQDIRMPALHQFEKLTLTIKNTFTNIQNNLAQGQVLKLFQSAKQSALQFMEMRISQFVKIGEKCHRAAYVIFKSFERIKIIAKEMMNKMNDKRRELFQRFKKILNQSKKKALDYIEIAKLKSLAAFQNIMSFLRALLAFLVKLKIVAQHILIIGRHLFRELVTELKNWS